MKQTTHANFPTHPNIAVLLNGNAKKVRPRLVDRLASVMPRENIFYSTNLDEANRCCKTIYNRQYDLVFTGGGDGTLLHCLTELQRHQNNDDEPKRLPLMGVLHLGTGNAVASYLGAHPRVTPNLLQAQHTQDFTIRQQRWVEVNGQLAPFAGTGLDSLLINHYKEIKQKLANGPLAFLGTGLKGYISALASMTIPHLFREPAPEIEIFNEGGDAYLIGNGGEYIQEFRSGDLLYSGPAMLSSVSTVPLFGYNVKAFPYANTGEHMQLRVAFPSVPEAIINIPRICNGTYKSKKLLDFHVDKICVRSKTPLPLQIGGDPADYHNEIVYQLSDTITQLADFSSAKQLPAYQAETLPNSTLVPHF